MSVTLMAAVWPLDMPTTDKMVLLSLADAANDAGVTWIAVRSKNPAKLDILRKCSLSERAVQGSIKRLCDGRYINRIENPGKGVIYTIYPAADAPRTTCAPQQTTQTPAAGAGKPLVTIIPSEAKASSGRARKFSAPDGVSDEQWTGFVQHRRDHKKGGPLNPRAYTLICNKLAAFAADGWPPGDMIDLAIERGWITVFKPIGEHNGSPRPASVRGSRPDPALDMYRQAQRDMAAEAAALAGNPGTDLQAWPSLPSQC